MMLILVCLMVISLCGVTSTYVICRELKSRLDVMQGDMNTLINRESRVWPTAIAGRLPPTAADLAAARNRMDQLGVAHPGGPG